MMRTFIFHYDPDLLKQQSLLDINIHSFKTHYRTYKSFSAYIPIPKPLMGKFYLCSGAFDFEFQGPPIKI